MKTVEFFATPQELTAWVEEWRTQYRLQAGVVVFQPRFEMIPIAESEQLDLFWMPPKEDGARFKEIWLSFDQFTTSGTSGSQIRSENRDCLVINLPKLTASTLSEASIGTVSQNPDRLKVWKRVISDLKKRKTRAGMWVINREVRAKGFYKNELYSLGTEALVRQGISLITFMGLEVFIDEPLFIPK